MYEVISLMQQQAVAFGIDLAGLILMVLILKII